MTTEGLKNEYEDDLRNAVRDYVDPWIIQPLKNPVPHSERIDSVINDAFEN